jgi:hypothetical protein
MSSLLESLFNTIGTDGIQQISRQLGADEASTENAITAILPSLMTALSRNARDADGAESLSKALSRDHDGSILDSIGDLLGNPQQGNGDGILRHVLGGKRGAVENQVSRTSGLDLGSVSQLMTILAPMVMGALGRNQRQQNLDPRGVADLLNNERAQFRKSAPGQSDLFSQLLDADGDGQIADDVINMGLGLMNQFFKKR